MMPEPQPQRTLLDDALDYLGRGWPVFPVCRAVTAGRCEQHGVCPNAGKMPLVRWERYQTTLPAAADVRQWWQRYPRANIGMATGALSGVVVLDADGSEARKEALRRGVPQTRAVWTGKPGGAHYHLAHPGFPVANFARRLPGLDFRGDGGYVLLPPSHHASGADYRWVEGTESLDVATMPDWLLDLVHGTSTTDSPTGEHTPLDLERVLAGIPEGARDDTLYRFVCKMRGDDVPQSYATLLIRQAARACHPPFDEADAVEKVERVYRAFPPSLTLQAPTDIAVADALADAVAVGFLRPISELLSQAEQPIDWLVDSLFSAGSCGWIGAEPKVGKSWLTLDLIFCLTTGAEYLDRFAVPKPRRVIYIQEEDSEQRVLRRFKQLLRGHPDREAPADDYLRFAIRTGFKIDSPVWVARLRAELTAWPAEVCVFDVFQRLHLKSENDQAQMAAVLAELDGLNREFGCAFIVVHHNRKPQAGNEARPNQMLRGSGVLAGWAECSLFCRAGQGPGRMVVIPESKDAAAMEEFVVTLVDTPDGGVTLACSAPVSADRVAAQEQAVMSVVQRLSGTGSDCTAQLVADTLGWKKATAYRILRGLVAKGVLATDEAVIGRQIVRLYTLELEADS